MNLINKLFSKKSTGEVFVNQSAPDFSLPDQNGKHVSLSDFKGERNVLLFFNRGQFCPTCQMILRALQKEIYRFVEKNIVFITITPDSVESNQNVVTKFGLDYKILCDSSQEIMKKYGCHDSTDTKFYPNGMPVPGMFLIDKEGVLRYCNSAKKTAGVFDYSGIFSILDTLST